MGSVVRWYVLVQCCAVAGFLLARPSFVRLPSGGYPASKALGVLLLGMSLWEGTAYGLLRTDAGGAALVLLLLAALAAAGTSLRGRARRAALRAWVRRRWPLVVATEVVFLVAFTGWAWVRAHDPGALHTERPMDLLMLVAVWASPSYPPPDPWLAGYPLGYYHVGWVLQAALAHLAGTPPEVAFNVGQACWLGLLASAAFGLGWDLVTPDGTGRATTSWRMAGGLFSTLAVTAVGNLHHAREWAAALAAGERSPDRGWWWWWRSSRAFVDLDLTGRPLAIIDELPFFSYLVGDDHPHLLAMPFVLVAVTLAAALSRAGGWPAGLPAPGRFRSRAGAPSFAWLALVVAALFPINAWDFPGAALLVLGTAAVGAATARAALLRVAILGGSLALALVVVAAPFLLVATSQVRGLLPNLFHPSPLGAWSLLFGAAFPGLAALVVVRRRELMARRAIVAFAALAIGAAAVLLLGTAWAVRSDRGALWLEGLGATSQAAALAAAGERWATGWPVLATCLAALAVLATAAWRRAAADPTHGRAFPLVLAAAAFAILAVPELVFVHDVFGSRMNTVFKLHYEAWPWLAAVAAASTVTAAGTGTAGARIAVLLSSGALALGMLYPVEALPAKLREAAVAAPTLDALALGVDSAERAAIAWLRRHAPPATVVAQAPGDSYRPEQARLAAATGRPALLGWRGHEVQWRGPAFADWSRGREEALAAIYRSREPLAKLLERWGVDLVVVGPLERRAFALTADDEARLAAELELAWEQGDLRIYRRRG